MKLKVTYRDPAIIGFYKNNARQHSEQQVEEIIASITDYGFNDPVDVDEIDGQLISMCGEGRIRAALKMGLKEIPTISLAHLSERQKRGYILAHNKIALNSSWDMGKLSAELDELVHMDVDITGLGFNEQELDAILKQDPALLPDKKLETDGPEAAAETGKSRAKSKILHTCPNCQHEFTA